MEVNRPCPPDEVLEQRGTGANSADGDKEEPTEGHEPCHPWIFDLEKEHGGAAADGQQSSRNEPPVRLGQVGRLSGGVMNPPGPSAIVARRDRIENCHKWYNRDYTRQKDCDMQFPLIEISKYVNVIRSEVFTVQYYFFKFLFIFHYISRTDILYAPDIRLWPKFISPQNLPLDAKNFMVHLGYADRLLC